MTKKEKEVLILNLHNEIWSKGRLDFVETMFSQDFLGHYPGNEWIGVDGIINA